MSSFLRAVILMIEVAVACAGAAISGLVVSLVVISVVAL